jgi:hypothetical protein
MPLIVTCPDAICRRQLRVPDDLLGQSVKCPRCGKVFTAREEAPPAPRPQPEDEERRPADRPDPPDDLHDDYEDDYDDDSDRLRRRRRWRRRDYVPHRGTIILVLGILSLVTGFGFILGPIAWVMGNADMREIRAGRMDPEGEGSTNAGRICGIIGTVLGVLSLLCCFLSFAAAVLEDTGRRF